MEPMGSYSHLGFRVSYNWSPNVGVDDYSYPTYKALLQFPINFQAGFKTFGGGAVLGDRRVFTG